MPQQLYDGFLDLVNNLKKYIHNSFSNFTKNQIIDTSNLDLTKPETWLNLFLSFFYTIISLFLTFIEYVIYIILFYPLELITNGFKQLDLWVSSFGFIGGFLSILIAFAWFVSIILFFVLLYYVVKFILDIIM